MGAAVFLSIMQNFTNDALSFLRTVLLSKRPHLRNRDLLESTLLLLCKSKRFVLPAGGLSLVDDEIKALSDVEELRLPYSTVVLEFETNDTFEGAPCRQNILLATETEDRIVFYEIMYAEPPIDGWAMGPLLSLVRKNWYSVEEGVRCPVCGLDDSRFVEGETTATLETIKKAGMVTLMRLVSFLNALACSNVGIQHVPTKSKAKGGAIMKDDYHVLTIHVGLASHASVENSVPGNSHRSPREHLRRGHVRRIPSGRAVWVNAHVVNAGAGARIEKDYKLSHEIQQR